MATRRQAAPPEPTFDAFDEESPPPGDETFGDDDIPEFSSRNKEPEVVQPLAKQTTAARMAQLEPQDMWRVSFSEITVTIKRHFAGPDGRLEEESHTLRAGSYDEYVAIRANFEEEWAERYANQPIPEPAPPPPPPPGQPARPQRPPQRQQQQLQQPQQPQQQAQAEGYGDEDGYCFTHNVWMTQRSNANGSWWSHLIGQDRSGKDQWCRGK